MYNFILNMWILNRITAEQVNAFIGKCITTKQAEAITSTAQINAAQ